jgi:hypothetical protein
MRTRLLRVRSTDDSGAAILLALFVIAVVAAMSVGIAGVVLSQSEPTQYTRKNIQTLHAAEGGIQAGLTRIRAAQTNGSGTVTKLPCTTTYGTTFSGQLGPDQGSLTYNTTITYYSVDPSDPAARIAANKVACSSSGSPTVPSFALVTSSGAGTAISGHSKTTGERSLEAVYSFSLTNANISGGTIALFQTSYCISAPNTVAAGQKVVMASCNSNDPKQRWSYNPDLTISLTGYGDTLCLYANPNNNTSTLITLASCDGTYRQQWSFNEAGEYEGTNSSQGYNGYCFVASTDPNPVNLALPTYIKLTTNCSSGHDSIHTWQPSPQVGAGHAGDSTGQLVNYKEFGRCLDDTNWDVNIAFLIDYPCKQTPIAANVDANQKFTWPTQYNTVGQIKMAYAPNSTSYCLQAGTSSSPPVSGTMVLTKKCSSGDSSQKWTATGNSGSNKTNYNFKTQNGLCLSIMDPPASRAASYPWSEIIVETCDGSYRQKWNAPPLGQESGLSNTWETTGTTGP